MTTSGGIAACAVSHSGRDAARSWAPGPYTCSTTAAASSRSERRRSSYIPFLTIAYETISVRPARRAVAAPASTATRQVSGSPRRRGDVPLMGSRRPASGGGSHRRRSPPGWPGHVPRLRLERVAHAAHGADDAVAAHLAQLAADVGDVDVHDVRGRGQVLAPDVRLDLLAA